MERYIDADKLIAHLKDEIEGCAPPFSGRANGKSIAYGTILGLTMAISFAETLPTADVAPKSEVARQIFKEIEKCRVIGGRHIFGGQIMCYLKDDIDELKKKYTEEQQ